MSVKNYICRKSIQCESMQKKRLFIKSKVCEILWRNGCLYSSSDKKTRNKRWIRTDYSAAVSICVLFYPAWQYNFLAWCSLITFPHSNWQNLLSVSAPSLSHPLFPAVAITSGGLPPTPHYWRKKKRERGEWRKRRKKCQLITVDRWGKERREKEFPDQN